MTVNILRQQSPELLALIEAAAPEQQRAAALAIARFAVERAGLADPAVDRALDALGAGTSIAPSIRKEVEQVAGRLDEEEGALSEAVDRRRATQATYEAAFRKARAATAVAFALADDPFEAATESAYEAQFAADDVEVLTAAVRAAVHGSRS